MRMRRIAARRAYAEAGISSPRDQLDLMEVHDCFSMTEMLTMEDLGISPEGKAIHDVQAYRALVGEGFDSYSAACRRPA